MSTDRSSTKPRSSRSPNKKCLIERRDKRKSPSDMLSSTRKTRMKNTLPRTTKGPMGVMTKGTTTNPISIMVTKASDGMMKRSMAIVRGKEVEGKEEGDKEEGGKEEGAQEVTGRMKSRGPTRRRAEEDRVEGRGPGRKAPAMTRAGPTTTNSMLPTSKKATAPVPYTYFNWLLD